MLNIGFTDEVINFLHRHPRFDLSQLLIGQFRWNEQHDDDDDHQQPGDGFESFVEGVLGNGGSPAAGRKPV